LNDDEWKKVIFLFIIYIKINYKYLIKLFI
jgi:hypothetical protein